MFCLHVYMVSCFIYVVSGGHEGVKYLDLKLVMVVSYGVGFRSQTLVLCKSFKAYNH